MKTCKFEVNRNFIPERQSKIQHKKAANIIRVLHLGVAGEEGDGCAGGQEVVDALEELPALPGRPVPPPHRHLRHLPRLALALRPQVRVATTQFPL